MVKTIKEDGQHASDTQIENANLQLLEGAVSQRGQQPSSAAPTTQSIDRGTFLPGFSESRL